MPPPDVQAFLEPLVDAIAQLVVASATGNMDDVLPCCTQISMYTVKLIGLGRNAAEQVLDRLAPLSRHSIRSNLPCDVIILFPS